MGKTDEIKIRLRKGLGEIEEKIQDVKERYLRGDINLSEYLDRRSALEVEKLKRVLENLKKLRHF